MLTVVLAAVAIGQVTPSVTNLMAAKAVDSGIARESALVQQVIRYKAVEGAYPGTVADLVAKGYWKNADNTNGFGGAYSINVDPTNNLVTVTTTIADATARGKYLSSLRHAFKPVDQGAGVVATTFVMPNKTSSGALLPSADSIPASSTAPNPATNSYWYDTSSGTSAVLKVSDGATWAASTTAGGAGSSSGSSVPPPTAANIVSSTAALPATANNWDVRYVQNAATNSMQAVVYYNGSWIQMGSGANALMIGSLATQSLPEGGMTEAYSYDFRPTLSAIYANTYGAANIDLSQVSWRTEGVLPAGMSINSSTGILGGIPTSTTLAPPSGNTVKVVATYKGNDASQTYLLQVGPARLKVKSIATGRNFSCAVTDVGGVKCWGDNSAGQLGNGTTVSQPIPTDVTGLTSNVASVAAGERAACAITTTGAAWCWGLNTNGTIGDNSTTNRLTPVQPSGLTSGVTSISTGYMVSCAIQNGAAKCWGANGTGTVGDATYTQRLIPTQVAGLTTNMSSISTAAYNACAVNTAGAAWCWGKNDSWQIGDGLTTTTARNSPAVVVGGGFAKISVSVSYACAAMTNGTAKCWGLNYKGQLGDGTLTNRNQPTTVPGLSSIVGVASGNESACALSSTGGVKCWGDNFVGTLGDGTRTSRIIPGDVIGLTAGVSGISAATGYTSSDAMHLCAMLTDGGMKCWGSNNSYGTVMNQVTTSADQFVLIPKTVRKAAW